MAADSAVAEKLDLDLVSRKASAVQSSFDPKPYAAPTTPDQDVRHRIERLQKTIDEIQVTARAVVAAREVAASGIPPIANASTVAGVTTIRPREIPGRSANNSYANTATAKKANERSSSPRATVSRPTNPAAKTGPVASSSVPVAMADVKRWKKSTIKLKLPTWQNVLPDVGVWATGAWLAGATVYLGGVVGWDNLMNLPAHQLGSVVAGIAAPLALIWMGINYLRRHQDIQEQIAPLIAQIDQLVNPNKQVEARIDAVSDGLRRQANELITATQQVEKTLNRVREGLRGDMEKLLEYAGLTGKHLDQASTSMANRTTQIARMTEQMHGRLVSFEEHAKSGSERLDQSVADMMLKAHGASDRLERQTNNVIAALHASNMRMQRTADDLDSRISQIANFADETAGRFGGVAAEFAKQGAVVDAATNNMAAQLSSAQESFGQQLAEMGQAIRAFAHVGLGLSGAVNGFRSSAEEVIRAAVAQIQDHTSAMDARLQQAQSALDRTAGATLTRVSNIDRTVAQQLEGMQSALTDAAADTQRLVKTILDETTHRLLEMDMRFSGSGSQVTGQLDNLDRNIGVKLEAMAILAERMRDDAGDAVKQSMVSVFSEIQELKDEFSQRARSAGQDMKAFHNDLVETIEALGHVARRATDRTVERILTLNAGISQRIMDLRDTASEAHSQGQVLETTLVQHIGMIRAANDQMSQSAMHLSENGARVVTNLRDASGQAMAQAEIVSHVMGREAEFLRTATAEAAASLGEAGATLESARSELYASVANSAQQINSIVRDLVTQQGNFEQTHQESAETHAAMYAEITRLRDIVQGLNAQLNSTVLAADDRATDLRNLTTRLGEVTLGMKAVMQVGHQDLDETAQKLEQLSTGTRTALMQQGQQLAEISAQVGLSTQSIVTTLGMQQDVLSRSAASGAAALDTMVQKLQNSAANVSISSETSARDLDFLSRHLQVAATAVGEMGSRAQESMQRAREAMVLSEASLQRSASSARINLSELAERYTSEGERVTNISDELRHSYGSAIKRLETIGHELAGQSFLTFDTLTELGTLFDDRIAQLRNGGTEASAQIGQTAAALQTHYASLMAATEAATAQLAEIQLGLSNTQSDVGLATNHAQGRIDAVRRELGNYAQDMMMMVAQASGQIEAAAAGFGVKVEAVRIAANENVGKMGEMGARVQAEIDQLALAIRDAVAPQGGMLSGAVERLRVQAEQLTRQTQQSVTDMERQGVRVAQTTEQIGQSADRAAQQITAATAKLAQQSQGVMNAGEEISQRIEAAARSIQTQTETARATAERAAAVMAGTGSQIASQTSQWQASAQSAQAHIGQLINSLASQLAKIDMLNVQAGETVKRLTQTETRARRDAFLNAAKYIIESLNSLSIDLTRVLDPIEAERTWKEFSKGDAAAFTRRFAQLREDIPAQRLREKYETDSEFRTYAMRYFRQFEELFEQAIASDHNDLIATTLTTSDVGKLYTYLAGALGHNKLKSTRAA